MSIDLHTHSTASDGLLSPSDLLARARGNGVQMLALTDHDNVDGVRAIQAQMQAESQLGEDLELVTGVEISCVSGGQSIHVVGLWIDTEAPSLVDFLRRQTLLRETRGQDIGERLARNGMSGCYEGALAIAGDAILSRPHFARHMVNAGYCSSEQQAFKRWLGRGKAGDVSCAWPELEVALQAIHAAGGVAVLAHPLKYGLTRRRLNQLLGGFCEAGGDGAELVSGAQPPAAMSDLLKLITQNRLRCSTGSDFHSPAQTWCDVGGQPPLPAAAECIWQQYGAV